MGYANRRCEMIRTQAGFTLIELLIVIGIIAVLTSLVVALMPSIKERGQRGASLNNLRQISSAVFLYAGENDGRLPNRSIGDADRWPSLLSLYLDNPKVFIEPWDEESRELDSNEILNNARNNSNYIMNGYNDVLGEVPEPDFVVRIQQIPTPSAVVLFGTQRSGSTHFYMDMMEGAGNHNEVLNLAAYGDGSNYVFADGSARYIKEADYEHDLWLVYKDSEFSIP